MNAGRRDYVNVQYALYDALVSINVPAEKARAVAESLDLDMNTTLATKTDLKALQTQLESKLDTLQMQLESRLDALHMQFELKLELLSSSMTIRLGSMLLVGLSLLFAALKLT
jgi:hypothetical protein